MSKRILIADDMSMNLDYIELILSKEGYTVEKAANGIEALEKIRVFMPDLLLIDNIMPKMSGKELVKIIRKDPFYKNIKIIMLSAAENEALEVDAFIAKPVVMTEALSKIRALLARS